MGTPVPRELRFYQKEAVQAFYDGLDRGLLRMGVVLATGLGKSTVIAKVAVDARAAGKRVIVLAHQERLLDQIAETVMQVDPDGQHVGMVISGRNDPTTEIVAASFQTIKNEKRFLSVGTRDLVIVDEVHHSAANTYKKVLEMFGVGDGLPTPALGVTATMDRADSRALGDIWQEVVYEKSLKWAIDNGFLVPPRGKTIQLEELDSLSSIKSVAGDYKKNELSELMGRTAGATVEAIQQHTEPDSSMFVFAVDIAHATSIRDGLRNAGITSEVVTSKTSVKERNRIYNDFADGSVKSLVNVNVLTEGADFPRCDTVVMARPTRSNNLYCFDAETEILTVDGWKPGIQLVGNEEVAQWDSDTGDISFVAPSRSFVRSLFPGEKWVATSWSSVDFKVTDNHRVYAARQPNSGFTPHLASELVGTHFRVPTSGSYKTDTVLGSAKISLAACLGVFGSDSETGTVLTLPNYQVSRALNLLDKFGVTYGWGSLDDDTTKLVLKNIPEDVLSISRFGEFDENLFSDTTWKMFLTCWSMWTGETYSPLTTVTVPSSYVGWVQFQAVLHGWTTIPSPESRGKVTVALTNLDRQSVKSTLHFEEPAEGDLAWCVTVPKGAVVIRRHGRVSISGNCQVVGRGLRPYTNPDTGEEKKFANILDIVGASRDLSLVTVTNLYPPTEVSFFNRDGEEIIVPDPEDIIAIPKEKKLDDEVPKLEYINLLDPKLINSVWLKTKQGVHFTPLRTGTGDFVFLYPENPEDRDDVAIGMVKGNQVMFLRNQDGSVASGTYSEARERAAQSDILLPGTYISPRASWRKNRLAPSEAQLRVAGGVGLSIPSGASRAYVSDALSRHFTSTFFSRNSHSVVSLMHS